MLHGNPTWSFFYRSLILGLRDKYRAIVPDHIGCGLSDKPDERRYDYTLARRVEDLEALLDHLGIRDNLTLVLHDWGGMIGMAYAERHPERIKRLVVLNTAAFLLPHGKRMPWSIWLGRNTWLGKWLIRGCNAFCRGALCWCVTRPLPAPVRQAYLAPYDSWANRVAVQRFVEDIPLQQRDRSFALVQQVQAGLKKLDKVPMLICWGERDFVFDHYFLAEWQQAFPMAEVHRFPDAGHYVLEDAGEEIVALVRDFLNRHPLDLPYKPAVLRRGDNICARVFDRARAQPNSLAIVHPDRRGFRYRHYTFAELCRDTIALARGLYRIGIRRGMRTVLMVPPGLDFFPLTFALFLLGAVVVLIDPGMGIKNLGTCLQDARPQAFIGVPKSHLARVVLGWAKDTLLIRVTVGPRLGWGGVTLQHIRQLGKASSTVFSGGIASHADELAAILFTSGSTGPAKGVMYTHGIFAAQIDKLRKLYDIKPGDVDLATFPLFGLFGPALGMTVVIPRMDPTRPANVNPTWIVNAVNHFGVSNLFGSPALIDRVGRYGCAHDELLFPLRRVISAGAPVPARVIERFAKILCHGKIHTPYGATEALPVTSISSDEILGETSQQTCEGKGVCVGKPVEGMTVRILRISDEAIPTWSDDLVLPAGEIGEIVVQGPVVTRAYFNRPEATCLAKIDDPATGGFWHRMGDVGYLDERGRLWFCGRKSQRVITAHGTMFTIPCEGVFNAHPAVRRTALVGVQRKGTLEPVLIVEIDRDSGRKPDDSLKRELLELGARHEHTRVIQTILFHPAFPVDIRHNAKIFREKLAVWATKNTQ